MASSSLWQRFQQYFLYCRDLDFSLDISRMNFQDDFFEKMQPKIEKACAAMRELEGGAIANPTEKRMVGHYWLRKSALAPNAEIRAEIEETIKHIKRFAADVHAGKIAAEDGKRFEHILLIGIGGSALGPQFVADALGSTRDPTREGFRSPMDIYFLDNTDPDGFDRVFGASLVSRRPRQRRERYGDPPLQRSAGIVQQISATAGHGISGKRKGSRWKNCASGHRCLRQ